MREITEELKEYFRSVPEEVTELPIFEDDNGIWFALGHVDHVEMALSINAVDAFNLGAPKEGTIDSKDMQYWYAKVISIENSDDVQFQVFKPNDEDAFPVTVWNFEK